MAPIDSEGAPLAADRSEALWYAGALAKLAEERSFGYALLRENFVVTSGNMVFTRKLFERVGAFSEARMSHDWDFLVRSLYFAEPAYVDEALMCYRVHGGNTTEGVRHLMAAEAKLALERYRTLLEAGAPPNRLAPCRDHWPAFTAASICPCVGGTNQVLYTHTLAATTDSAPAPPATHK